MSSALPPKLFLLFFIFFGKKSFSTGVIYIEGMIGLAGLPPRCPADQTTRPATPTHQMRTTPNPGMPRSFRLATPRPAPPFPLSFSSLMLNYLHQNRKIQNFENEYQSPPPFAFGNLYGNRTVTVW